MRRICISSGHGLYVRGAEGILDEVNEARRVVDRVADAMRAAGYQIIVFHDDVSHSQSENLDRIIDFHNSQDRDLDVSVHFNAYLPEGQTTDEPKGTEVFYVTQDQLAANVSEAIADAADLPDRGAKYTSDLAFLNGTEESAILIETCFVDSSADANHYRARFEDICAAIAAALSGDEQPPERPERPPIDRPERPPPDETSDVMRPTIREGDYGSDVRLVQDLLGVEPIDGDFGPVTVEAVKDFQNDHNLDDDGVVGPMTWDALDEEFELPPYPMPFLPPLPREIVGAIEVAAAESDVVDFLWDDRGQAPLGYVQGMALAYATVVRKFERGDGAAVEMAKADVGNEAEDALALYRDEFQKFGMDNSRPGRRTLRHVFVFLIGLGMRESSGYHCEGRDMSAENVQSDTAEAGLFQASWNFHVCCTDIVALMDEYLPGLGEGPSPPQCQLPAFQREVECGASDWENYGSGAGRDFQALAKECPAFAVESAAIGIRNIRQHWGPIGRGEVQITREANALFEAIDAILATAAEVA